METVLGSHELRPWKMQTELINAVHVLTAPQTGRSPVPLPRQNNAKLGQLITQQWPLSVQMKNHTSLTFNQQLEVIKFSKEGT